MALFAAAQTASKQKSENLSRLPTVMNKFNPHHSIHDDLPSAVDSTDFENFDKTFRKRGKLIGDVRVVNMAYTRLRVAEF